MATCSYRVKAHIAPVSGLRRLPGYVVILIEGRGVTETRLAGRATGSSTGRTGIERNFDPRRDPAWRPAGPVHAALRVPAQNVQIRIAGDNAARSTLASLFRAPSKTGGDTVT